MREDLPIEDAAHGAARWRTAVREHPGSAAARYALGVALVRAGIEDEAEAAFREAASCGPGGPRRTTPSARPFAAWAGTTKGSTRFPSRPAWATISPFPASTSGWRSRSAAGTPRRRTPSAGPRPCPPASWNRTRTSPMTLALLGRHREAADAWRDVVRLDPARPGPHAKLGWALCRLGEHREAAAAFRDALRADPGCREALGGLGWACAEIGDLEEAAEAFREEANSSPGERRPLYNLGTVLGMLGRHEEAVERLAEAVKRSPGHAESRYNLGVCLFRLHRHGAAAAAFREALRLRPGYAKGVVQPRRRPLRDRTARGSGGGVPRSRPGGAGPRARPLQSRDRPSRPRTRTTGDRGVPGGGAPRSGTRGLPLLPRRPPPSAGKATRRRPRRSGERRRPGRGTRGRTTASGWPCSGCPGRRKRRRSSGRRPASSRRTWGRTSTWGCACCGRKTGKGPPGSSPCSRSSTRPSRNDTRRCFPATADCGTDRAIRETPARPRFRSAPDVVPAPARKSASTGTGRPVA